jgi:transcriptional regulator with XRE-family HTH domain
VPPYLRAKFERHRLRMSQQEVGDRANPRLSQSTVSAIESGRVNPSPVELAALAQVLGVSDPAALLQPVRFVEDEGAARG